MTESTPPEFWERADAVIHLANEQCTDAPKGKVSASLLYATARFNSFVVASMANDLDELKVDRDEAISHFTEQYRKMFIENLDDYIENYGKYLGNDT